MNKFNIIPLSEWGLFPEGQLPLIAGPCSAESQEQVLETARALSKGGCRMFRAGVWKPRTRPGCFEGCGEDALKWMKIAREETGMSLATEVAGAAHVKLCLKYGVDLLWLGARTTGNPFLVQEIADTLEGTDVPVLVKNPMNPDLALWEGALERLNARGVRRLGVIHRGFTSYEKLQYRNDPLWTVALNLRSDIPDVPMFCDPSHMGGKREFLPFLSQRAVDLGFDGLMVESHCNPCVALSDAAQQLVPEELFKMLGSISYEGGKEAFERSVLELREKIDLLDSDLLRTLSRRLECCREIGRIKKNADVEIIQPERWEEVVSSAESQAQLLNLDAGFVSKLFSTIHKYSIEEQSKIKNGR